MKSEYGKQDDEARKSGKEVNKKGSRILYLRDEDTEGGGTVKKQGLMHTKQGEEEKHY